MSAATESVLQVEVQRRAVHNFIKGAMVAAFFRWQTATVNQTRDDLDIARANQYAKIIMSRRVLAVAWQKWLDLGRNHLSMLIATENISMRSSIRAWRRYTNFKIEFPRSNTAMRAKVMQKFAKHGSYQRALSKSLSFSHWKMALLRNSLLGKRIKKNNTLNGTRKCKRGRRWKSAFYWHISTTKLGSSTTLGHKTSGVVTTR